MKVKLGKFPLTWIAALAVLMAATACRSIFETASPVPATSPAAQVTPTTHTATTPVPCFYTYYDPFAFLPGTQRLLVRAGGGVQIFNLESMREQQFITAPTNINGPALALSPDGKVLAWALEGGTVQRVQLSNLQIIATMRTRQAGPLKLEFSPDGKELYSASHDGTVKVWGADGSLLREFMPAGEVANISLSPDGRLLAVIPADGPLALWKVEDFTSVAELGGSGGYDTSDAVFSPDGTYLAADLATGLFLWRLEDGAQLLGSEDGINSMAAAYSPDGRYLAYASLGEIVLTSPDGSQHYRTFTGHQSPVFSLLFSPDGTLLVSADDLEIRLWRVEDGQLLARGKSGCP